jgi:hypothetical protein
MRSELIGWAVAACAVVYFAGRVLAGLQVAAQ